MEYSDRYDPETDFDAWYTRAATAVIVPLIRPGDNVLELGCATGAMTSELVAAGASVVAVERSPAYLDRARLRSLTGVEWIHSDLDEWTVDAPSRFHHVLATNVLHEVQNPLRLLRTAREAISPGGMVHVTLQNPLSIHRRVGLHMDIIGDLRQLSPLGEHLGSHGLWSATELVQMGEQAGLTCLFRRGLMLKPLPNARMAELPPELLHGFMAAAVDFPDSSAMNYLLLTRSADADCVP